MLNLMHVSVVAWLISFESHEHAVFTLERLRWMGEIKCTKCGHDKICVHKCKGRPTRWQCWKCNTSFSVTVGTMFEGTHIPLHQWLKVIGLIIRDGENFNDTAVAQEMNFRRPTIWNMRTKIGTHLGKDVETICNNITAAPDWFLFKPLRRKQTKEKGALYKSTP